MFPGDRYPYTVTDVYKAQNRGGLIPPDSEYHLQYKLRLHYVQNTSG